MLTLLEARAAKKNGGFWEPKAIFMKKPRGRRGRGHTGLVAWAAAPPFCLWFPWRDLDERK